MVVFGGNLIGSFVDDTWAWSRGQWDRLVITSSTPAARAFGAMAYDEGRDEMVLYGGRVSFNPGFEDTWLFDGARWHQVQTGTTGPGLLSDHEMVYDGVNDEVVLFGGIKDLLAGQYSSQTWVWDGTRWEDRTPPLGAPNPAARSGHGLTFDRSRGTVILHAGTDSAFSPLRDTWEWDGSSWSLIDADSGIPARFDVMIADDEARDRIVLYGGGGNEDQWEFFDPDESSVVQFDAQLPGGFDDEAVTGVLIRGQCAGEKAGAPIAPVGAELVGWLTNGVGNVPGAWVSLVDNAAGLPLTTGGAATLDYRSPDADVARSLLGPEDRVYVQCRSQSKGEGAEVAMDYVEVRVRYELD